MVYICKYVFTGWTSFAFISSVQSITLIIHIQTKLWFVFLTYFTISFLSVYFILLLKKPIICFFIWDIINFTT